MIYEIKIWYCINICASMWLDLSYNIMYRFLHIYGSGHEGAAVLLPGFAIS